MNILTMLTTLPYCERQAYFSDLKSVLQQIDALLEN